MNHDFLSFYVAATPGGVWVAGGSTQGRIGSGGWHQMGLPQGQYSQFFSGQEGWHGEGVNGGHTTLPLCGVVASTPQSPFASPSHGRTKVCKDSKEVRE